MSLPYGNPLSSASELNNLSNIDLMARMIFSEAGNQSLDGMRGVAHVAYNRVAHSRFPSTLKDVLLKGGFAGLTSSNGLKPDTNSDNWKLSLDIAMKMPGLPNPISNYLWFNGNDYFNNNLKQNNGKYKFSGTTTAVTVTGKKVIGGHTFFIVEGY